MIKDEIKRAELRKTWKVIWLIFVVLVTGASLIGIVAILMLVGF